VKRKTDIPDKERRVWTDADFEDMSWHDNHVHGFQIRSGDYGAGELDLDLDYIVEWLCAEDGSYEFRLAPATLTFREVTELRIELDYQGVSAGLVPFSIDGISREDGVVATESPRRWTVNLNWPRGLLAFRASGFTQRLRAPLRVSGEQCLGHAERTRLEDA
jgi:hypothetical protein